MARFLALALFSLIPAFSASPFAGRWNFNITTPGGTRAAWLGIADKGGPLEVWYQPTGGNVYQVKDVKADANHLTLDLGRGTTWELEAAGDKLTGYQKRSGNSLTLTGLRAPELKRNAPKKWSKPEPLFDGKTLDGWEPMGTNSHWGVKDGLMVNEQKGANLKSTRKFDDLKLHFEVNCPDHANSGFYLRGRYEVQLEYEPLATIRPSGASGRFTAASRRRWSCRASPASGKPSM